MKNAPTFLHLRNLGVALLLIGTALACSRASQTRGAGPSQKGHFHPVNWVAIHPGQALAPGSVGGCKECHEMSVSRTGSGIPSCMTADCHHNPIPGWAVPGSHGAKAKMAQDASGGGMASCQLCHGSDFGGGLSTNACQSCHTVKAPHPVKPWRNSQGSTHVTTDPSNALVCAQCHFPGSAANPPNHPATPASPGAAPGCFNNTLCHGNVAPHILGTVWLEPTSLNFHGLEAKKDLLYCQSCHGTPGTPNFDGGSAATKCSSCHTAAKAHSKPWRPAPVASFPGYVPSHRNSEKRDVSCSICHDYTKGRTAPVLNAPSCYSSAEGGLGCHANGPGQANHSVPFLDTPHTTVNQAGFNSNCNSCHSVTGVSPLSAAPLCTACHRASSPLVQSNCTSCHAKPPTGSIFPDVAGTHAKHDGLTGLTGHCSTCHNGSDSGTLLHYNHANGRAGYDTLRVAPGETAFLGTFNSKAGSASFDPSLLTCSNVSCHGGKITPSWQNGAIDVNSEAGCQQCHAVGTAQGKPENNSAFSGLHAVHMAAKAGSLCIDCHAMANGSTGALNHFKFLDTPQMEGPASVTIAPLGNPAYYNIPNQTCGNFVCHGQQHTSYSWIGGPNHAVPFIDSAHFSAKQSGFDANCKNCHADTGSSPIAAAPLCSTCHQTSSVLTVSNCASCHAKPPVGTTFPNVSGKHSKHDALAGVTGACSSCHTGSDSLTLSHYDHANARPGKDALRVPPAPTAFLSAYNAKSGTATFNPAQLTCSSVSCHGGLPAPSWQSGTIDSNSDAGCRQCHSLGTALGVPENNSLYSGLHAKHLGNTVSALCTDCHIMTDGTPGALNHFKSLDTTQMEGPASSTIAPLGNHAFYNVPAQTCGTFDCHGVHHGAYSWNGGPNHAIPYLGAPHTTATQSVFDSDCKACHSVTGISPLTTAPLCSTCHQAGTPLTVTNCASCHAKPPTGDVFPNVSGKHGKHDALAGVTGACSSCHSGSDSGSQSHYDHANARPGMDALRVPPAPAAFLATYNAKSGTATFNPAALTCSSVSCHGGLLAPSWQSGTIDSNSDAGCRQCHSLGTAQGVPENNSPYSGLHAKHLGSSVNALCTECHIMSNGTTGAVNHFKFLGTAQMEGPASSTVAPLNNPAYYNVPAQTCGTFDCHGTHHGNYSWNGGPNHAIPFLTSAHTSATQGGFDTDCKSCHAVSGTSPLATAPLCVECHQAGSPLTVSNCASCHAKPPTGSAFPNVSGKHSKHDALAGVTGACSSCHTGSETGTQSHYDHANGRTGKNALRVPPAPTTFLALYNAKSGTATFNPAQLTCSSVSCHGGVLAPSWQSGTIDPNVDAGCRQCHTLGTALGVPQYNSPFSGLHAMHLGTSVNALCTECHIMSNSTAGALNHFKFLGTTQMEGPASSTVAPLGTPAYYNIPAQTCGTFTCHGTQHGNFSWNGGPNHAVPFLGAVHSSATQSGFDADCKNCHAVTGTSPLASAPLCNACHQAGSPLTISNCASCHAKPPTGSAFPNIAGRHANHDVLAGVTGACNVCHNTSGTTTQVHYDHANGRPGKNALRVPPGEVQTISIYNAKTGAATFNTATLTCSNTSCHGGQTTPNWQTGTMDVNTQCTSCHALGTTQYNSYNSGEHQKHVVEQGYACTECHNTTTLATNHFTNLGTSTMEGPASANIGSGTTSVPSGAYNISQKTCTLTCHGKDHQAERW